MAIDPNISNGTCYYSENSKAKGDLIPCGNIAVGHWPCCYAGDICLGFDEINACWDATTGNTYLGGCTDIGFNSRACPWKSPDFATQEWVAVQQCDVGTGNNDTEWGGCKIPDGATTLEKLPHASCDPYCSTYIYKGTSAVPAFASLPNSTSSTITWTSGFDPVAAYANPTATAKNTHTTSTGASTAHITSSTTGPTATVSPSMTSTGAQPTSSDSSTGASQDTGLSTGAKAGIGVGTVGAVLLIVAVVFLGMLLRRRRKKAEAESYDVPPEQSQYTGPEGSQLSPKPWTATPDPHANNYGGAEYSGFKSELPADESAQAKGFRSELPADEPTLPGPSPNLSAVSPRSASATYNQSDLTPSFSDSSTVHGGHANSVSPQSTGDFQQGTHNGNHVAMAPISELQG